MPTHVAVGRRYLSMGLCVESWIVFRTQQVVSSTGSDPWEIIFMTYRPKLHPITSTVLFLQREVSHSVKPAFKGRAVRLYFGRGEYWRICGHLKPLKYLNIEILPIY